MRDAVPVGLVGRTFDSETHCVRKVQILPEVAFATKGRIRVFSESEASIPPRGNLLWDAFEPAQKCQPLTEPFLA